jgi:hypothetical protein
MKREDAQNNYNFLKNESNKLIKSLPLNKLTEEELNKIINITICSTKIYINLPQKYKKCLEEYINTLINGE